MSRTVTIQAGEISAAAEGLTYNELAMLADAAEGRADYRASHVLCMAAAMVATTAADKDSALSAADEMLDRAMVYQPDPIAPIAEVAAPVVPVVLDWSIPVYRVAADGSHVSGPGYGAAPAGASWRRPTAYPPAGA